MTVAGVANSQIERGPRQASLGHRGEGTPLVERPRPARGCLGPDGEDVAPVRTDRSDGQPGQRRAQRVPAPRHRDEVVTVEGEDPLRDCREGGGGWCTA